MWIIFAIGSAFFAGITSVLAKCGIKETDSNTATAIRTIIVLVFSWMMVVLEGSLVTIVNVTEKTWIFLILSGLATGASWLFYFKALQTGNINRVVPVDKSSTILTILFALLFLKEGISWQKGICILLMGTGTYLMVQKKEEQEKKKEGKAWLLYAVLSAIFASLTAILGKVGIEGISSNLGTAIRTCVVLVMAWLVVFISKKQNTIRNIPKKELGAICVSGVATGASWLCYYRALQEGSASVVVPIDKMSILVTITFSYVVFKEKLSAKALAGLFLLAAGTLLMVYANNG